MFAIRLYQGTIARILPVGVCGFYPTCSAYSYEAIATHGAIRGLFLTVKRLSHCHPYGHGGYDPVPSRNSL